VIHPTRDTGVSEVGLDLHMRKHKKKEMQQMMEFFWKELRADREDFLVKMEANKEEIKDDRKSDREEMLARMDTNMKSGQEQIQENLKRIIEETMTVNQAKTDVQLKELMVRTEKTQMELQSVEESLYVRTEKFQENLTKNYNETYAATDEAKRQLHARLDKTTQTRVERANITVGACVAQPPMFDGNTTWSVFR
jgi:hypothetical protein